MRFYGAYDHCGPVNPSTLTFTQINHINTTSSKLLPRLCFLQSQPFHTTCTAQLPRRRDCYREPSSSSSSRGPCSKLQKALRKALKAMSQKRKREKEVKFYGVRYGHTPGVYALWQDCLYQAKGYKGAQFKSFPTAAEAQRYVNGHNEPAGKDGKFYAVKAGKVPGIYKTWEETLAQISGVPNRYKSFSTRAEAQAFMNGVEEKDENDDDDEEEPTPGTRRKISPVKGKSSTAALNKQGSQPSGRKTPDFLLSVKKTTHTGRTQTNLVDTNNDDDDDDDDEEDEDSDSDDSDDEYGDGFDDDVLAELVLEVDTKATKPSSSTSISRQGESSVIEIYTDGSSQGNGKASARAGIGVWFGHGDSRNLAAPLNDARATNNRAELTAILRALELVPMNRPVLIHSDSKYAISCLTQWFQKWRANNWKTAGGKEVENRDIVEKVLKVIEKRVERGGKTRFQWVNGHTGNVGNEAADQLANEGARLDGVGRRTTMPDYLNYTHLLKAGFSYHLISVFGSQSTGKSTLLNYLFNTSFPVMNENQRQQTTKGIWMSLATDPANTNQTGSSSDVQMAKNILVMDVEGTDGRERGEDQDFERKSALFALATSEVLIINIWEHQVGLYQGANMGLLKTVFEVNLQLFQKDQSTNHRSLLFFVIRDHIGHTPLQNLCNTLIADLNNIWYGLSKPPGLEQSKIGDFFDFTFAALPHKILQPDQFKAETQKLKLRFRDASSSSVSPAANSILDGQDQAVFLPAYHRRIPADGLPHYAGNIWRMITENKDLDLPTQQELLAQYRCDEISTVCVEGFDSIIVPFEEALSQKTVQPGLGEAMTQAREQAMGAFTEEAGRYHKGVYARKREELEKKLLARLKVLYVSQLLAAHKKATLSFREVISRGIKKGGADFASLVESTREQVLSEFVTQAKSCSMKGTFPYTEELKAVETELDEAATKLRGEEMTRLLNKMEKSLRNKMASEDDGVSFLFKHIHPSLYPKVWDLWTQSVNHQADVFLSKSRALNATSDENARAIYTMKKRAWRVLRIVLDEETRENHILGRLMANFDNKFRYDEKGVPRVWRAGEDIEGEYKSAKDNVQEHIPDLAVFKLADGSKPPLAEFIGPAPKPASLNSALLLGSAQNGDEDDDEASDSDNEDVTSPNSPKTFIILTPGRVTALSEAFSRQADQAFVDAKRGTISSVSQIPLWFYGLLLAFGWNELWAVLRNPLYFMFLLIAGVGAYGTWRANLWGPLYTVGQATTRQAIEVGKEKLRDFLEVTNQNNHPQRNAPMAYSSGSSTNGTTAQDTVKLRSLNSQGKRSTLDDDEDDE